MFSKFRQFGEIMSRFEESLKELSNQGHSPKQGWNLLYLWLVRGSVSKFITLGQVILMVRISGSLLEDNFLKVPADWGKALCRGIPPPHSRSVQVQAQAKQPLSLDGMSGSQECYPHLIRDLSLCWIFLHQKLRVNISSSSQDCHP